MFSYRYLQNYVDDLFAGAWEKRDVTPLPPSLPMATDAQGNILFVLYRYNPEHTQLEMVFAFVQRFHTACIYFLLLYI